MRPDPREALVLHDAQRIDVGPGVDILEVASRLLGTHVRERARDRPGHREPGPLAVLVREAREAEVQDLDLGNALGVGQFGRHQDVARFEIAVDDPSLMGVVDRAGDLGHQPDPELDLVVVECATRPREVAVERRTRDQFHREERLAVVGRPRCVDRCDARVLEAREGRDLALEHGHRPTAREGPAPEHLERDPPAGLVLLGLEDHPHAALAEDTQNAIPGDLRGNPGTEVGARVGGEFRKPADVVVGHREIVRPRPVTRHRAVVGPGTILAGFFVHRTPDPSASV